LLSSFSFVALSSAYYSIFVMLYTIIFFRVFEQLFWQAQATSPTNQLPVSKHVVYQIEE